MSLEKIEEKIDETLGEIVECQELGKPTARLEKKIKSLIRLYLIQLKNDAEDERADLAELLKRLDNEVDDEKERQRKKDKLKLLFIFFLHHQLTQYSAMRFYVKILNADAISSAITPKI